MPSSFAQKNSIHILLLLLIGMPSLFAQLDSAQSLPVITIKDSPSLRTGFSIWNADTLPVRLVLSMAERLLWESPLAVRANAPGTLTTASARGAGPSRTAVFWQGLNLQSPMNGVVDISLVPVWSGDQVKIQYGGQSAAQSTGSMGGQISLIPEINKDTAGWAGSAGLGLGSFGRKDGQLSLGLGTRKLRVQLRSALHQADNDFTFHNTAQLGQPLARQVNNAVERFDLQQYSQLELNENNKLGTAFWYQKAFREIPPSMTEAPRETWQKDQAFRGVANWLTKPDSSKQWRHRFAWLEESIIFNLVGDLDTSQSRTAILESEYLLKQSGRLTIKAKASGMLQQARVDGYADTTQWFRQLRFAGFFMAEYQWPTFRLNGQVRQEWAEQQGAPFTWTLGARWAPWKQAHIRMHLSRNFNLPTFNDRFWRNLGNQYLRPESGYSSDLGIDWNEGTWTLGLTMFHLLLDDWILWQPGPDGLFRPANLRQVWSRGLEFSAQKTQRFLGSRWKLHGRYQVARATNTAVYGGNAGVLHRQLPYTPEQIAGLSLQWAKGYWTATYLHQFTGQQYTTADNSSLLQSYHTGNLFLQYQFRCGQNALTLNGRGENLWGTAYQTIAYRPMPGRSWHLGFQWGF